MNYEKIYYNLIEKAKSENRVKTTKTYYESHHIKPMFLFNCKRTRYKKNKDTTNPNNKDNVVLLTFKEHVFAHVLLYKMFENTQHSFSALSSLNLMMGTKGNHKRASEYLKDIDYISKNKEKYSRKLSNSRKGMVMCKDVKTGNIVGFIDKNDPKYISGEYVFFHKGIKRTDEFKLKKSRPEDQNFNYSGYSDETLLISFLECCVDIGFIPSLKIWICWSRKNDKPHLTSFKKFRFGGNGFKHMVDVAEKKMGIVYNEYFTRQKQNFKFIKENEHKWVN